MDAGIGIFVEVVGGRARLAQGRGLGQKLLRRGDLGRIHEHLLDVFQLSIALWILAARAKGHQAEGNPIQKPRSNDLLVHLSNGFPSLVDIALHGDGRIDHEHHRGAKRRQFAHLAGLCRWRCRNWCCRHFGFGNRGHLQTAQQMSGVGKILPTVQDGQQIEILVDIDIPIRLDGKHPRVVAAAGNALGQRFEFGGRIIAGHQGLEAVPGIEKQGALALGPGIGEGHHQLLPPGHRARGFHPAQRFAFCVHADLQPLLGGLLALRIDVVAGKGVDRGSPCHARLRHQFGPGTG